MPVAADRLTLSRARRHATPRRGRDSAAQAWLNKCWMGAGRGRRGCVGSGRVEAMSRAEAVAVAACSGPCGTQTPSIPAKQLMSMGKRVYLRGIDKILEKRKALFCPSEGRKFERRAACCVAIVGRDRPAGLLRSKCVPRTCPSPSWCAARVAGAGSGH